MLKRIFIHSGLTFLLCGFAFAKDATFEFEGRQWFADLDSNVKVVSSSIGSNFDFKDDLGADDENFPEARFTWHITNNSRLRLAYTKADFDGEKNITRAVEFDGRIFNVGTRVISDFDVQYLRAGWIWQFINLADKKISLGPIIELKAVSADMSLEAPDLSIKEAEDLIGGLPTLGVALDINPIKKINLFAEISGISAGEFGYFFDAETGIKVFLCRNFNIVGGYRIIDMRAENDPDFVKVKFSGPFVGATLRF